MIATVFEEIYRREATAVLTQCDGLLEDPQNPNYLVHAKASGNCNRKLQIQNWVSNLNDYIQKNYERPDILSALNF